MMMTMMMMRMMMMVTMMMMMTRSIYFALGRRTACIRNRRNMLSEENVESLKIELQALKRHSSPAGFKTPRGPTKRKRTSRSSQCWSHLRERMSSASRLGQRK